MNNLLMEVENEIAVVTINRPKSLNALNSETLAELDACFSEISERKDIKVVILTGSGAKAFVAGADISEMVNATPAEGRKMGMLAKEALLKNLKQCLRLQSQQLTDTLLAVAARFLWHATFV